MMIVEDSFSALLETLYSGLTRSPPWEDFLRALARAADANYATLLIGRGHAGIDVLVSPDADPVEAQRYHEVREIDPFVGLPEGKAVTFNEFVGDQVTERFRDWWGESGLTQILGVDLERAPDIGVRLRLTRDQSLAPFGEVERALLTRLIPHFRIALDLHARLTTTQAESQLFSGAMAELAVATLILDRDGRIMRRNAVAERMLEDGAVITEENGRLTPRIGSVAKEIKRILGSPPPPGEEASFEIAHPAGEPWQGRARAVPSAIYGDGAYLALFLKDPASAARPSADMLRDRFQLTRAEAALALQLMEGVSVTDAARSLDITYNTARSHLRAIFAKTGTNRQAQLVMLLHSIQHG